MKIDNINQNIKNSGYYSQRQNKIQKHQVGFTSNIPQATIEKEINALNPTILKGINKLKNNIGEFQDICINALGTGLLAPIFIKYNPLPKTDEDTRTYSAWRQPLSALLAIATQGLFTIPIVSKINSMANEGALNLDCNKTPFKDKDYAMHIMKKLHPGLCKQQRDALADEYLAKQVENLVNTLRKENTVYYTIKGQTEPVKISPEKYTEILNKTVESMLSDEEKRLKVCNDIKLTKRIERSEFYRNNYDTSKNLLNEVEAKINSTDDIKEITKFLKNKHKELKKAKADKQLLDMLTETRIIGSAGKDKMLEKVKRMQGHVEKYKGLTSKDQVVEAVNASISERINEHKDSIEFLNKVKKAIAENKTVNDIEEMFKLKIKEAKNANKEFRLADKVFSKEVANKLKELTKKHIDGVKRIATLAGALIILPISCDLLNRIYPRFMDIAFPKLSSKKHNNESKELVDKATKNSEVK